MKIYIERWEGSLGRYEVEQGEGFMRFAIVLDDGREFTISEEDGALCINKTAHSMTVEPRSSNDIRLR